MLGVLGLMCLDTSFVLPSRRERRWLASTRSSPIAAPVTGSSGGLAGATFFVLVGVGLLLLKVYSRGAPNALTLIPAPMSRRGGAGPKASR
jgi:hypothetical protein